MQVYPVGRAPRPAADAHVGLSVPVLHTPSGLTVGSAMAYHARCSPNRQRLEQSTEHASNLEHRCKAGVHLFLFDEFTTIGGGYSLIDCGQKARFFVQIPGDDVLHQPFGDRPCLRGDLRKVLP